MGDEEDHGVLAYVVDDGDAGQVDAEQYAREAAEDEGDGEESGCREPDKWTVRIEVPVRISAYSNNKPLRISALN